MPDVIQLAIVILAALPEINFQNVMSLAALVASILSKVTSARRKDVKELERRLDRHERYVQLNDGALYEFLDQLDQLVEKVGFELRLQFRKLMREFRSEWRKHKAERDEIQLAPEADEPADDAENPLALEHPDPEGPARRR